MLGVVLWSDNTDNKAVIWCEDHGDLAFFNGGDDACFDPVDLDAGDLVRFDLQQEKHLRYAHNPKRIEQGAYDGIAEQLQDVAAPAQRQQARSPAPGAVCSATIVPFARRSPERADREMVAV